jgi:gamma-glutamyltranspeptidase/glutathione hydrolase
VLEAAVLAAYQPRWRSPITGTYRGHRIVGMPPPSAGGFTVLGVLSQLETLAPDGLPYRAPQSVHLLTEAMRRSYVDRVKYLGDPSVMKLPIEMIATPAHFAELAHTIDPAHATPSKSLLPEGKPPEDAGMPHHTTHLSVIDKDGNAVALTTTRNYGFGSCLVAKGTGVLLNDEMDDFAAQPLTPNVFGLVTGETNAVRPGKTPLSSMSPTLVFQKDAPDQVMIALGSPGGPTIPTATLQVILHVIDHGMSLQRAVDAGRIHNQYLPDQLIYEKDALEPATRAALEAMGHHLREIPVLGTVEAVSVDPLTHLHYAATDPRAEGAAAGQD